MVELDSQLGPVAVSVAQGEEIAADAAVHWDAKHGAIGPLHKETEHGRL